MLLGRKLHVRSPLAPFALIIADLDPAIQLSAEEESGALGEALKSGRAKYVSADLRDKAQVLKGRTSILSLSSAN